MRIRVEPIRCPEEGWDEPKDQAHADELVHKGATLHCARRWARDCHGEMQRYIKEAMRLFPEYRPDSTECDIALNLDHFETFLKTSHQKLWRIYLADGFAECRFADREHLRILAIYISQPAFRWMQPLVDCGCLSLGASVLMYFAIEHIKEKIKEPENDSQRRQLACKKS